MTELDQVDSASCPHCRADVAGEELDAMVTAEADEAVLVCPECNTMLGGAMGDGMFTAIASVLLAEDVEDVATVAGAVVEVIEADSPSDLDEETVELLNDRMGPTQLKVE